MTVAPLLPCTHYTISIKPTAAEGERADFDFEKVCQQEIGSDCTLLAIDYMLALYQIASLKAYLEMAIKGWPC